MIESPNSFPSEEVLRSRKEITQIILREAGQHVHAYISSCRRI